MPDAMKCDTYREFLLDESVHLILNEKKSEMEVLKANKKPLDEDERKKVMDAKAVWHHGPGGAASPAVWKSVHPDSGKVTYVCNTHRAYNVADTVDGCIKKFHSFIKDTA
jgi:hypothetical protein